ncbi:diguanylate cyclase (GGDEF)-like protein [Litorivivens lipolytica]|uniref:diguanylate cyclase n=1 Tax=Litorivivens lipolytica TaxID=1524264 RepID=A0A7W4W3K4_9GAMM|nr:diguanylate cyclase [Litorivivens lipolytica]MBB3046823.1 diguanylate cyclase (GGDEF)-like protein [Litorivivens lipolytica]
MAWKILVALFGAVLLGLELAGRTLASNSAGGIPAVLHAAGDAQLSLPVLLVALCLIVVLVAAALYAALVKPIKDIAEGVGRVHPGRADVSLPHQGSSGVLGALANAVAELVERQSRELAEAQTAGQQAARQVETLELRLADRERELEALREHCATLQGVDEATDLPNRAAFDAELDQELLRIKRNGNPLAIALFQVSQLELLNSRMGANQANMIMRNIGQTIRQSVRITDYVARYDDHTFVLMLPETPARSAATVVEDIHRLLGSGEYTLPVGVGPLKIAAGLASTDVDPNVLEAIPTRLAQAVSRSLENEGRQVEVA